jgi:hypothetical protein
MSVREQFLSELRDRTQHHLQALARESAVTFARFLDLPDAGPRVYLRLVAVFQMDGAQEIAATLIDLVTGALDEGAVMLTDREYRGLQLVHREFSPDLPEEAAVALDELLRTLERGEHSDQAERVEHVKHSDHVDQQ